MYAVRSVLGGFLRKDREAWVRDSDNAANFKSAHSAEEWIEKGYGKNGKRFFYAAPLKERNDNGNQ